MRISASFVLSLIAIPVTANASLVLDQSHPATNAQSGRLIDGVWNHTSNDDDQVAAQTFTVGIGGTLKQINLSFFQSSMVTNVGPVTLQIVKTLADGSPSILPADVLTSVTIPQSSVQLDSLPPQGQPFPLMSVNLGAGLPVSPGEVLAVVLLQAAQTTDIYYWNGDELPYAGGQAYQANYANPTPFFRALTDSQTFVPHELGFQTFVDTPEPVTMLSSLPLLYCLGIRRRQ